MLREGDGEKEILLGNKQLLGIFFLVVILLGVAFAGGYKLGQGSHKMPTVAEDAGATAAGATNTGGGETHAVAPEPSSTTGATTNPSRTDTSASSRPLTDTRTPVPEQTDTSSEPPPLGARTKSAKSKGNAPADSEAAGPEAVPTHAGFAPQTGQIYLQVAAVQRDEAEGISDVLRKKGFRAHAVPKPASKLYRVIIGPVRDASDLNATRTALRNTGFREIFVQRY